MGPEFISKTIGRTLVSIIAFLAHSTIALDCSAKPLALRYEITLSSQGRPRAPGAPFILGDQSFAARVDALKNCTGVPEDRIPKDCPDRRKREIEVGGFFDPALPTTYRGPNLTELDKEHFKIGKDILYLGDDGKELEVGSFSFITRSTDYYNFWGYVDEEYPAYIGLNRSSTILKQLYNANAIPSKVWSLFAGWNSQTPDAVQNSILVLGGYDRSKLGGEFVTFNMSERIEDQDGGCPLRIHINGMTMEVAGDKLPIGFDFAGFDSCVDPTMQGIGMPQVQIDSFRKNLGLSDADGLSSEINYFRNEIFYGSHGIPRNNTKLME
ncbi:hypothetical protein ABW19_dt0200589 [Dactylella cylindrospora]|nr:hypothetical protein ABW19_dt0200589 [Dactylella cylindrospora]